MSKLIDSNPLVTVYIPTYNRVKLLERAVNSVLKQTYKHLEVIIVDDCSTDGTEDYLKRLKEKETRVRYILKEKNLGACNSRNMAIKDARGLFVTGLDDDDYFEKDRIEFFLNAANSNEDEAYYTNIKLKVSENVMLSPSFLSKFKRSSFKSYEKLLKQNFIGNQIFIKTDILRKSGGFDESFKAWQDLECWYNLMRTQSIKMNLLTQATQVIDISHEHERITKKNVQNVMAAFKQFSQKHNLNKMQQIILRGQLIQYMPEDFSTSHKLLLFLLTRQGFYLKRVFNRSM